MDVTALVRKLREGQKELKSNIQILTTREGARQKDCRGKQRVRKSDCSPEQHHTKRARTTQLSAQQPPPRRLSSTPKVSDNVPSLDLSLEDALGTVKKGCHDSRVRFAEDSANRGHASSDTLGRHSFLVTQQAGGDAPKIKGTGTTLSFTQADNRETASPLSCASHTAQDLGTKLVESLNASKFGALESSRARALRGFPRHYKGDDPRLGYDWIAGMLDIGVSVSERDDRYFVDLREFRRVNRSECCQPTDTGLVLPPKHNDPALSPHSSSTTAPAVTTSVSSYVLNGRLFPIPVHHHSEPGILCPVCEGSHDQNGTEPEGVASARYIKVSIPRCTFQPVSRLRTRRKRRSPKSSGRSPESATESMGLSKHCKAGWETAQPAMVAPQPSISLKAFLSEEHEGNHQCPSDCISKRTLRSSQRLLNTSHSMHYDQLARGCGQ